MPKFESSQGVIWKKHTTAKEILIWFYWLIGLSVACDGVCLTLISYKSKIMEFYLSKETIIRSKFKFLKIKDKINLELPLKYGTKISGHICQGHVDTVGKVLSIKKTNKPRKAKKTKKSNKKPRKAKKTHIQWQFPKIVTQTKH